MTQPTAIYAGSFNPFTIGHADIVQRALSVFPHVVVAVGFNAAKTYDVPPGKRRDAIAALYEGNPRVSVHTYSGLTVDFAQRFPNPVLLRGIRTSADFETEMQLADVNRRISGIDTVLFTARPELACVSSSTVRELRDNGFDTTGFLPIPTLSDSHSD